MSNNYFRNIFELRQKYSIGQGFYYSCLDTDFEWFDKIFSITTLIEPILLHISRQIIIPDNIDNEDKYILHTINETNINRKYLMQLELANMYSLEFIIYEKNDKSVIVIHKNNFFINSNKDEIDIDFIRLVIHTQRELENYDVDDTIILEDDNYDLFKKIYISALNLYPEEIIKMHDKNV